MKSLYFRSFVVSVLFARFHFKVIRKSLYSVRENTTTSSDVPLLLKIFRWKDPKSHVPLLSHLIFRKLFVNINNPCDLLQCYSDGGQYSKWLWFRLVLFGLTALETVLFLSVLTQLFPVASSVPLPHDVKRDWILGGNGRNTVWGHPPRLIS